MQQDRIPSVRANESTLIEQIATPIENEGGRDKDWEIIFALTGSESGDQRKGEKKNERRKKKRKKEKRNEEWKGIIIKKKIGKTGKKLHRVKRNNVLARKGEKKRGKIKENKGKKKNNKEMKIKNEFA